VNSIVIIAGGAALAIVGIVLFFLALKARAQAEATRVIAEAEAKKTLDSARLQAETQIRGAQAEAQKSELDAKERLLKAREASEQENAKRRSELVEIEKRILQKEEALDKKIGTAEKREQDAENRAKNLDKREKRIEELEEEAQVAADKLISEQRERLEKIAGLTAEQAKKDLIRELENEARLDATGLVRRIEEEALDTANQKAKRILSMTIQRMASEHVVETTVSVLDLPSDDMKGRIIGREGRNIRAVEAATGVDIIIDDTPEAVLLSSFDPIRREVARLALEKLVSDGRIHPGRIEEVVNKSKREVDAQIVETGEQAAYNTGVHGLHPELIKLIGRMKWRTSYGQNILQHSQEVAHLAGIMAAELGLDVAMAKRGALLHDVGKVLTHEHEGTHVQLGVEMATKYGENPLVVNCIAAHHDDVPHESEVSVLVQAADAISGSRPGARREAFETYVKRLEGLERIASSYKGVERVFAIQAGREIRVVVVPDDVDDGRMTTLSEEIARRIEAELQYPGQIKVVLIRETRAVDFAR
jgi:ribonuclease Y